MGKRYLADTLVIFSCINRLDELGPILSTEIDGLKNIFNALMAGFLPMVNLEEPLTAKMNIIIPPAAG